MAHGDGAGLHASRGSGYKVWLVAVSMLLLVGGLMAVVVGGSIEAENAAARTGRAAGGPPGDGSPLAGSDTEPGVDGHTSPSTTSTTVPGGPEQLSLVFAGDLLPHGAVNDMAATYGARSGVAYDYSPMFTAMRAIVEPADVAICHMEVPSAPDGEPVTSYPSFGAPPELVDGAGSAGYDGCTTASNHSLDRGKAGLTRLLDQFDSVGLLHNGTARTAEEGGGKATVYEVDGVRVANLSYAYGFNGYKIPDDAPWSVNEINVEAIQAATAQARADGADLVVLSLHWGTEYDHDPSAYQRDVADRLLPSPDIDVIIGHHAHVVQPVELVEGTYVVFGLGNQLSNQTQPPRRDGLTARLTAERADDGSWSVTTVEAIPTYVDLSTFRVLPVVDVLADPETPPSLRDELVSSYERTAEVITAPGTPGVTIAPRP